MIAAPERRLQGSDLDRRLLDKFGWGPCKFEIFGSGLTSVEDVDAPIGFLGEDMPCGYVGSR